MLKKFQKLLRPYELDPEEREQLVDEFLEKREKNERPYYRKEWVRKHPEDAELDAENMRARQKYDEDGIRNLMAAICLTACSDYQRAIHGRSYENQTPPYVVMRECERHFDSEMMNFFTNGMEAEEIEEAIRKLPPKMALSVFIRQMRL